MKPRAGTALRVAIACPGIGLVQRGFERFFYDLFQDMRGEFDVTLFKGDGDPGESEKVPRFIHRNSRLARALPLHRLVGRTPLHTECLTFGLSMLPSLGSFDVVHTIDPPLTRMLFHLRNRLGLRFRLLYTEGTAMPPGHYPPADHVQQVAKVTFDEAVEFGHPAETMTLLPVGFHPQRFELTQDRDALRRAYGIDDKTFVILSVSALSRRHKRTDHLIDEVAGLDGNFLLWLDGSLDSGNPELVDYAHAKLGKRCRVTQVPSTDVGKLYRLADLMVHAANFEAFGLAVIEAAASGLPVLIHNAAHFQWLIPNPHCWFDTMQPGALNARLAELMRNPTELAALQCAEVTRERFSWERLHGGYTDLYRHVARLPARTPGVTIPLRTDRPERSHA